MEFHPVGMRPSKTILAQNKRAATIDEVGGRRGKLH
jgi:hypothetical protein